MKELLGKNVFSVCKSIESEIQCKTVGYQHAGIMNYQTIINHNYKKNSIQTILSLQVKIILSIFQNFLKEVIKKKRINL